MKKIIFLILVFPILLYSQKINYNKFDYLIGKWKGLGTGSQNEKSTINSEFKLVLGGNYIEVKNNSKFEPTAKNPKGEHHIDKGIISYDAKRNKFIFRQFHIEGYVIQYVLVDSLSYNSKLVFESENIENFVHGGKTRWTIKKITNNAIETTFDVSFPNKDYKCIGENKLIKISE